MNCKHLIITSKNNIAEAHRIFTDYLNYPDFILVANLNLVKDIYDGNLSNVNDKSISIKDLKDDIDVLKNRLRDVIVLRYGLGNGEPKTLLQVSMLYSIKKEAVRQLEVRALYILKSKYNTFKSYSAQNYMELKNSPDGYIEYMNFSIKTYNALKRAKLNTLKDILSLTRAELLNTKFIGEKAVLEIEEKLAQYGFKLKEHSSNVESDLASLNLSNRTYYALTRANIKSKEDLLKLTPESLIKLYGIGKKGYAEVLSAINATI